MLIYICCAGGMTSSMFCQKISKASNTTAVYFGHLTDIINDFEHLSNTYPTLIAYGGEGEINHQNLAPIFEPYVDQVLVCPQVRYKTASLQKILDAVGIPCNNLDMRTFGNMNGEKALADILELQKEFEKE